MISILSIGDRRRRESISSKEFVVSSAKSDYHLMDNDNNNDNDNVLPSRPADRTNERTNERTKDRYRPAGILMICFIYRSLARGFKNM